MLLESTNLDKNIAGSSPFTIHNFHGPENKFFPKYKIEGQPSANDDDPYCFGGTENWEEIGQQLLYPDLNRHGNAEKDSFVKTPRLAICLAKPNTPPYYQEMFQAEVLIKKNIGFETGLVVTPNGDLFVTSGVYQAEGKLFVLLARPAHLPMELTEILKKQLA